jgi:16S rRNA (guanine(966)-N(2))-methyltransferase RsmD
MRITGGVLRGRLVAIPEGKIRPAMDRMRESVFATLGDITNYSFLDIFSGSGIIALEAASRGANPVDAVELDPLKRKTLLKNVSIAPIRIQCHFQSAELYIKRTKKSFNIIFCDPPFPYKYKWDLVKAIAGSPLMESGSLLLLHRNREDTPPEDLAGEPEYPVENDTGIKGKLIRERSKSYGRSIVDFIRYL